MRIWKAALAIFLGMGVRSLRAGEPISPTNPPTTNPAATNPAATQPIEKYWAPKLATTQELKLLRAHGFTPPASKLKEPVAISGEDALHMFEFRDGGPRLQPGWEKSLPKSVKPTPSDPATGKSYEFMKNEGTALVLMEITRVSARHAVVGIFWEPPNPYLVGGPSPENVATLLVPRTKAVDAALDMKIWVDRYAPTYNHVSPGDPWLEAQKQLGKPARSETAADGVVRYFYDSAPVVGGTVEVDVFDGIVWDVKL